MSQVKYKNVKVGIKDSKMAELLRRAVQDRYPVASPKIIKPFDLYVIQVLDYPRLASAVGHYLHGYADALKNEGGKP